MKNKLLDMTQPGSTLNERLGQIHDKMLEVAPGVDRIACAIYDAKNDLLKTFINSTRHGVPLRGYEFKLSDSVSLSEMAKTGKGRVIDYIPASIKPVNAHSAWVLEQGYQSSFTAPMFDGDELLGFLFLDSTQPAAFTPKVQRDLILYANLINMAISAEMAAMHALIASAEMARDFAHLRDFETGAHIERMARLSRVIAKGVAETYHLSDEFIEQVYLFSPLHDIGKIGIPDKILMKPGKFLPDELAIMRTHVDKGVNIINKIINDFNLSQLHDSAVMLNIVACHHEFLDGSGYPKGLKGDAVPVEARIVTTADILDALTNKRPYKSEWTMEEAIAELERMTEMGKLDANCVAVVSKQKDEIQQIINSYQDA